MVPVLCQSHLHGVGGHGAGEEVVLAFVVQQGAGGGVAQLRYPEDGQGVGHLYRVAAALCRNHRHAVDTRKFTRCCCGTGLLDEV